MRAVNEIVALGLVAVATIAGCAATPVSDGDSEWFTPTGKSDGFISNRLAEYRITLTGVVEAPTLEEAQDLAPLKAKAMAAYLTVFLRQKDDRYDGNLDYGGFLGLVANESVQQMNVHRLSDRTYAFDVEMVAAAAIDLEVALGAHEYTVSTEPLSTRIPMRRMKSLELEALGIRPLRVDDFHPDREPAADLEWFEATFVPEPAGIDAYPEYWGLWEGGPAAPGYEETGTLDVAVFFGFDEDGKDTSLAREMFDWMVWDRSMVAPVRNFDDLAVDAAPIEGEFYVDGGRIPMRLRVSLVHSRAPGATDEVLRERFVRAMAEADVVVYNGHAWLYHGFYLGEGSRGAIESDEISDLEMPADRQQLLVVNGCATYANYAGQLYAIEGKGPHNLDVLTTMNISAVDMADNFTEAVVDSLSFHAPHTYLEIIDELNNPALYPRPEHVTIFGAHGIADAPRGHPFADVDQLCNPCERRQDCGRTTGTSCIELDQGDSYCATICLHDQGCPDGFECRGAPGSDRNALRRYCLPALASSCGQVEPPGPVEPTGETADPCERYELYGDGFCDWVCSEPDPDCDS